ncbi:hypothetical protein MIMGU_mgv11b019214mg [Erythranthe guttata]|uniref:DUF7746 domain-containing protein n=1 Tax=Erythranthe guttata TaxID=4155 RepID=A0A022QP26_ERYGU|nr:hypothetical protein MIMGU_mgv11b019214mg [Erythranthe guttata]
MINTLSSDSDKINAIDQFQKSQNLINPIRSNWTSRPEQIQMIPHPDMNLNLDNLSQYNILSILQQMKMAANAYKTQYGTLDKTVTELLIAGFSDEEDNPEQDSVTTLILTISLHFIGHPSHLKDRNGELLSNLRCRKLSDFQNYKNTFLSRVMLREDSNQPFWKEKFVTGLPTLLSEKIRNKIRETNTFKIDTITLFDTDVDLNCIKTGIVPQKFHKETKERLSAANNSKLKANSKTEASVINNGISLHISFVLINDIHHTVILGTPFINLIIPYRVDKESISSNYQYYNKKIENIEKIIEFEIYFELPNAFWSRKQHIIDLLCEKDFNETQIPTKARPIQMNSELVEYCKKEIQYLEEKKLISKSRSPWSCAAFYVNKQSEI